MPGALLRSPETWTEEDLRSLIGLAEGPRLDFKRELRVETREEKKEFLRDLTSFANASGGLIVYGIAEGDSGQDPPVATELCPLDAVPSAERLENILVDGTTPPPQVRFHLIPSPANAKFLVAEIAPSLVPVQVLLGDNRYYVRRDFRRQPMTHDELQIAFRRAEAAATTVDRLLKETSFIYNSRATTGYQYLLAIPHAARKDMIGITWTSEGVRQMLYKIFPFDYLRYVTLQPTGEGFEAIFEAEGRVLRTARILNNGILEFGDHVVNHNGYLTPYAIVTNLVCNFALIARIYEQIGYYHPFEIIFGFENIAQCKLEDQDAGPGSYTTIRVNNTYTSTTTSLSEFTRFPSKIAKLLLDRTWRHFGYDHCWLLNRRDILQELLGRSAPEPFKTWLQSLYA